MRGIARPRAAAAAKSKALLRPPLIPEARLARPLPPLKPSPLGVPDPGLALAKADLAARILLVIDREGLTQAAAGKRLGIGQPKVSALLRGRLEGFSTDRLVRFLTLLGCDVRISVSGPRPEGQGGVRVVES